MITQEQFKRIVASGKYNVLIEQMEAADIDPIVGLSFVNEFLDATKEPIENIKVFLEKKYKVDVSATLFIEFHGVRDSNPLLEDLLKP